MALTAVAACEGSPARSKPWRHAPDPAAAGAARGSESPILASEAQAIEARRDRGHTLRIHMDAEPRHLNPMVSPSVWTLRIAADTVFESLLRYEPPEGGAGAGPGRLVPGLARSWKPGAGGRELRVELAPDVVFHDGQRLTSMDVQFSLDTARLRADSPYRAMLADVAGVDLTGPRSVRIRLGRPSGPVLRALAEVPILPAAVYDGRLGTGRGPLVGTGPWRFAAWEGGVVRLVRFERYHGPAPAIAELEFVYEPDAAAALMAAKDGQLDLIPALIPAHYPDQASAPAIAASFTALRLRPPELRFLAMGQGRPPFDDARVRRAVSLLVDRNRLIKEQLGSLARPVAGPIWPGGPGDGAAPDPPRFDPPAAIALLEQAGWRDRDGDGVRERDGAPLRVALLALGGSDGERDLVVKALRTFGFVVEVKIGTPAVLRSRLVSGEFDLAFVEWSGAVDRDLAPLVESGGALNFGGFASRRVDELLAELRPLAEPADRFARMGELAALLDEEQPVVAITAPDPYGLIHRRVGGVVVWNGWVVLRRLSLAP